MTVEKLERVLWRIRKLTRDSNPTKNTYNWNELKRAIMIEIGTDPRTYYLNKKALISLQWLTTHNNTYFKLTDKDLE